MRYVDLATVAAKSVASQGVYCRYLVWVLHTSPHPRALNGVETGNRCSIDERPHHLQTAALYAIESKASLDEPSSSGTPFNDNTHLTALAAMRFLHSFVTPLVLLAAGAAQAASSWGFDDATVQVNAKKGAGTKEKYAIYCTHHKPGGSQAPVTLGWSWGK
jgi:hypothetical protein